MMIIALMIYVGISFGSVVLKNVPMKECVFISACLSLSSTPLVIKFLQGRGKEKRDSPESECGQYLMGMLVMQDVQLGKSYLISDESSHVVNRSVSNPYSYLNF